METLYGVSTIDNEIIYIREFDGKYAAEKWLYTDEYDYRVREIMTYSDIANVYADVIADNYEDTIAYIQAYARS